MTINLINYQYFRVRSYYRNVGERIRVELIDFEKRVQLSLTDRQQNVCMLKLKGYTTKEIAVSCGCSVATVERDYAASQENLSRTTHKVTPINA